MPPFDATSTAGRQTQAANQVVLTDGNGDAAFGFAQPYTQPPVVVATGGNGEIVWIRPDTVTTTGFVARFRTDAGAPIVGVVRLFWIATPATQ